MKLQVTGGCLPAFMRRTGVMGGDFFQVPKTKNWKKTPCAVREGKKWGRFGGMDGR